MGLGRFTQIEIEDWRDGPYLPIAGILLEPVELHERCGVKFDTIQEDLGLMDIAYLQVEDGAKYILTRYKESPGVGTEVWALADTPDNSAALAALVNVLELDASIVLFVSE